MIKTEETKLALGTGSKDQIERLSARVAKIARAWVFDNYVVTSCGTRLMFC